MNIKEPTEPDMKRTKVVIGKKKLKAKAKPKAKPKPKPKPEKKPDTTQTQNVVVNIVKKGAKPSSKPSTGGGGGGKGSVSVSNSTPVSNQPPQPPQPPTYKPSVPVPVQPVPVQPVSAPVPVQPVSAPVLVQPKIKKISMPKKIAPKKIPTFYHSKLNPPISVPEPVSPIKTIPEEIRSKRLEYFTTKYNPMDTQHDKPNVSAIREHPHRANPILSNLTPIESTDNVVQSMDLPESILESDNEPIPDLEPFIPEYNEEPIEIKTEPIENKPDTSRRDAAMLRLEESYGLHPEELPDEPVRVPAENLNQPLEQIDLNTMPNPITGEVSKRQKYVIALKDRFVGGDDVTRNDILNGTKANDITTKELNVALKDAGLPTLNPGRGNTGNKRSAVSSLQEYYDKKLNQN